MKSAESVIRDSLRSLLRDDIGDDIDDIPITELGVDSLDFFDMLLQLEEEFDIVIPIEKLDEDVTLRLLVASVCSTTT